MARHAGIVVRAAVVLAGLLSVVSMGGLFVYTAPVLLPAYWFAARGSRVRPLWGLLAAVHAAEVMWAAAYSAAGGDGDLIAVGPVVTFVVVLALFSFPERRGQTRAAIAGSAEPNGRSSTTSADAS
jgi:hypothetical protein